MRTLRHIFTSLVFLLLNSVMTIAVMGLLLMLSRAGDEVMLAVEALLVLLVRATVTMLTNQAERLAGKAGTVRVGSLKEAQADQVLRRFRLAGRVLTSSLFIFWIPAFAALFYVEARLAFFLQLALLFVIMIGASRLGKRIEHLQKAHGYSEDFGRTTP